MGNGVSVSGALSSSSDVDWFQFDAKAGGSVTVSLSISGSADLDWYLYPATNTSSYLARGYTTSNPETASATLSGAGSYLVKVVGYSGATGSYSLKVSGATSVIDP
ncbi:MAG TPA: PPC domain-containing protein [Aggregicoccus sp.]|nr:PPC domain-containing protein [Aggregicoccus sp.]